MSSTPRVQTVASAGPLSYPFPKRVPRAPARSSGPPPLTAGDRLTRAEFERRYLAHPEIKRAELIEGVVHMPSPTRFDRHSRPHRHIATWLGMYEAATSGTAGGDNATVRLDFENEVQPDALLRLESRLGGRSQVTADDYLVGPPELIVEIAASSAAYDLHDKRRVYQRSGVQEYLALQVYEQEATWFALREGVYEPLLPDAAGILHSEVFPGLWLDVAAFWAGDLAGVLATLQRGLASLEHAAFVAHLDPQP
ncbi:MAG: Uma2 family endonuclease [Chloroflexi bacterium]|nr:Uma2 family endonuclease [Chloroflexota bacterium]